MNENLCRICLTSDEKSLVGLFDLECDQNYAEKFLFCSGIEISSNDELPKKICSSCLKSVLSACEIKEKCIQTDFVLRQQLKHEPTDLLSVKLEENEPINIDSFASFMFTDSFKNESSAVEYSETPKEAYQPYKVIKKTSPKSKSASTSFHKSSSKIDPEDDTARRKPKAQDFRCFFCDKVFEKISFKNVHVKTDHRMQLECTVCHVKKSSALAAERCIKDHVFGFDYLCPICAKTFRRRCYLALHEATVHAKKEEHELFMCDLCGIRSKYRENLARHMKSVHSTVARVKFTCTLCPEKFYTTQTSLNIHMYREHKVQAPVICTKCHLGFTYVSELKHHRTVCRGNTNTRQSFKNVNFLKFCEVVPEGFKCKDCPRIFAQKEKWSWHYSSKHKSHRYCEICDKTFGCLSNYKRHIDTFHKKIKKYICDYPGCGKAYCANKALKDHKNTHTGEKPYACPYCSFRTGDNTTIIKHRKKMHKDLVEHEILQQQTLA